jgi:hypothetical protein
MNKIACVDETARLDPAGPVLGRLGRLRNSSDLVEVVNLGGVTFDLTLAGRDDYSHSTRIREYSARVRVAVSGLSETARLASLGVMARELIRRGAVDGKRTRSRAARNRLEIG